MPGYVNIKALGLNTSPNSLGKPEGSLEEAKNVIIQRDNIIEPRRGFKLYGDAFPSTVDRAKQLISYKNRILRHYSNILQYDSDGNGNFENFSGIYNEAATGLRIKSIEANGNLYFTTSDGIKKLSAASPSEFNGSSNYITNAGGIKAVDLISSLNTTYGSTSGFLPQDSCVAYRVVWGTKDVNNNLILGTPSQRSEIYNSLNSLMLIDYAYLLDALDKITDTTTSANISFGQYINTYKLSNTSTPSDLANKLALLVTEIDKDILYAADVPTNQPLNINTTDTAIIPGVLNLYLGKRAMGSATIVNYLGLTGDTITVNGTTLTEGIDWIAGTSNNATASSLEAAIESIPGVYASVTGATITIIADSFGVSGNSITLSTTGGADLTISGATLTGGEGGDASNYLSAGDKVYLNGFSPNSGSLNGIQTVASAIYTGTNSEYSIITITTTATGPITYSNPTIESGTYRSITPIGTIDSPTPNSQLLSIQKFINEIITNLKLEPITVISLSNQNNYINSLTTTTSSNVDLVVTIPEDVNENYFYQVYRSDISEAEDEAILDNLSPNDEMQLIYEAYPTALEISSGSFSLTDITPDAFRDANLYTNEASGEGILQSNDIPPFAKDITTFKGVTFYANCRTRYRLSLNLLGVEDLISEYNAGRTPKLTIASSSGSNTYTFVTGIKEQIVVNFNNGTPVDGPVLVTGSIGRYWLLNSAEDKKQYYVWYNTGTETDPSVPNKIGIEVKVQVGYDEEQVTEATRDAISKYLNDFNTSSVGSQLTVINTNFGYTTTATNVTMPTGFFITETSAGQGEDASNNQVLLSTELSPAISVDETARSLVRVINKNTNDVVYAYYISGTNTIPGKIELEARTLSTEPFYLQANNSTVGENFNPDISPLVAITSINTTTDRIEMNGHGLLTGDKIFITGTVTNPSISGIYTITRNDSDEFSIGVDFTTVTTVGSYTKLTDAIVAENNNQSHRVYYSKYQQPEAVPQLNYYDVGASDKAILRIFPNRDSLFVFKEDGLYRISGESIPFSLTLADSSCILTAPDSIGVLDNNIYAFTQKGISSISEAGVNTISRSIDNNLLKLSIYPNFKSYTFATSYESDSSYLVWTITSNSSVTADICYRYSILTNSWTTFDKKNTCAIIHDFDDKLYLGAGDTNYIEQERKSFSRYDYSDRDYSSVLALNNYQGDTLFFGNVSNFEVGDVIEQTQTVSRYAYNMLLKKLDFDTGPSFDDYFSTLNIDAGINIRNSIETLYTKLELDNNVSNRNFLTTDVNILNDEITIIGHGYYTGTRIQFSSTGTLPTGLVSATDYYVIKVDNNKFKVASSLNDANFNVFIDITTVGSGTHTSISKDLSFRCENKTGSINNIEVGSGTVVITTTDSHGLLDGRVLVITSSNSTPSINGTYKITVVDHNKFSINTNVNIAGNSANFSTVIEDYADILVCYNYINQRLNENVNINYSNYEIIDYDTSLEAVITEVNRSVKSIKLNKSLDFLVGPVTVYKAIKSDIRYSPITGGDPQALKHIGEATIMFSTRTFTIGTLSFSTDLLPEFVSVPFVIDGNGIFGNGNFGEEWFGGEANSAPVRTYLPRNCQRHRYLNMKFSHSVARENYYIFGITLFGDVTSQRAYR